MRTAVARQPTIPQPPRKADPPRGTVPLSSDTKKNKGWQERNGEGMGRVVGWWGTLADHHMSHPFGSGQKGSGTMGPSECF